MTLPQKFIERMSERLGINFPAFLRSYEKPPEKGLKVVFEKREDRGYLPLAQTSDSVCSMEKVTSLGFSPKIGIREGFLRTINYFSSVFAR